MRFNRVSQVFIFFIVASVLFLVTGLGGSIFAKSNGSVCFDAGAFDVIGKGGSLSEGYDESPKTSQSKESVRFIQIDKRPPVQVTSSKSAKIVGLSTTQKHRVKISKRADMKEPIEGFSFSFLEQGSPHLCLWYNSFYGSWIIQPKKGSGCSCQ